MADHCPLLAIRCRLPNGASACRYDLTNRKGLIDGRCLTKAAALAEPSKP